MYVIIFSIDKNYELYQELEEGVEMVVLKMKNPLVLQIPLTPFRRGNHTLASPNHQL
jgi:hypothetical protein